MVCYARLCRPVIIRFHYFFEELTEKEPKKYAARRSSLLETDKLDAIRCLSSATNDTSDSLVSVA